MEDFILSELERTIKMCPEWGLHGEYMLALNRLYDVELTQPYVDYLCNILNSKKFIWEVRFKHLRVLLLNPSAKKFDLKEFYFEKIKRCRKLALKIFFIRGYAMYASEEELNPVMSKFCKSLERGHDYLDYNYFLAKPGLPYLVETYGYQCFVKALEKARENHQEMDPLLKDYFTLDERLEHVDLLSSKEALIRSYLFFKKLREEEK